MAAPRNTSLDLHSSDTMRVAFTNNFFPPRVSGSAHLTEELAKHLAQQGVEVLVVTTTHGDAPLDERRDGYRVVRLPSWALPKTALSFNFDISLAARPGNFRRLWRLLDAFAPDVLHQHGQFFDLTFMSSVWARRRRIPTVLSIHTRLEHPFWLYGRVLAIADRTLVRASMAMTNPHLVVMDTPMREYIDRRYAVPDERMVPIPVGVGPTSVDRSAGFAVRERLGIGQRPLVLSLGHVIPVRDRLGLVEALPALLEKRPDALVVVVGHVYDDGFLRRAEALGVGDHIVLTGSVPRAEVADYVAASDVEVHDLQGHGLGTASLEVLGAGVPVVAVARPDNFPGISLRSWENIVLVEPDDPRSLADAIVHLLDDPELAQRVGAGQQRLVHDHFTLQVVTAAHVAMYERVLSTSGPTA
jgi:glycosyltransferase involved in cell wall biosynthesis